MIARVLGKRVLMWTHGWLREETGLKKVFRDSFYRLANGLLLYNRRARAFGKAHGFRPERLHVVYNSLDTAAQTRVRESITDEQVRETREEYFPGRTQHPVLSIVARLMPAKKIDLLIEAAAILEQRGTPVNVLVVGNGTEKDALAELAKNKDVHAHFTGALYDESELGRMFLATDLTVMPGPIGLLVMHSLVYGTPMITNSNIDRQMPEFEAITEGVTGGFFEDDDAGSLADAIGRWLTNAGDPDQIRAASRAVIENFYNPLTQSALIDRAVSGYDAEDHIDGSSPDLQRIPLSGEPE